jgi:two-component system CheB/CheR fusion protein
MSANINDADSDAAENIDESIIETDVNSAAAPAMIYVGIGASAGGLEALRALLPGLPVAHNITYVVAQHMDPKHPSLLREILARISPMPIGDVCDGLEPCGANIYVTPPATNVTLCEGRLRLEAVSHVGPKPSVDNFFISLADDAGSNCAGIILSGTGSDGAHGIRAIKGASGLTFCQDDTTAKYNGMPRAAIQTGLVDMILPAERIGRELAALIALPLEIRPLSAGTHGKTAYELICQQLLAHTGSDFRNYKTTTLQRRIARRMAVHRLDNVDEYIDLLRQSAQEAEALFKDILISVTSFFRDPEAYAELDNTVRELVRNRRSGDPIRIWVAGTATGEEAYSIAMLFDRAISELEANVTFQIFASDLDVDALAIARRGVYLPGLVKNVPQALIDRYFIRKDDTYHVIKHIRERVVFARQDLVRDPPFSRLDLISCRNLLIYFNPRLQKQVIALFHYVLRKGGYMFLGKSEAIGPHAELFQATEKGARIFRALPVVGAIPPGFGNIAVPPRTQLPAADASSVASADKKLVQRGLQTRMEQSLIRHYAPTGVVIDEQGNVLHLVGNLDGWLQFPAGRIDTSILGMIREDLRIELRALLHRAAREGTVRGELLTVMFERQLRGVRIEIFAVESDGDEARAQMLLFNLQPLAVSKTGEPGEMGEPGDEGEALATLSRDDPRMQELEQELVSSREHLQTTIEELETSNEELQSTNEELQSANEELQSANEELETSNEELQSTNEELSTVNDEMQIKSSELGIANADLENILAIVGLPLLVVDNHLRLTRFTQAATQIFTVKASDMGESVTTLACRLPLPNLRNRILAVVQDERPQRERIVSGAEVWLMRIEPYFSEQRRAVGVLLVFEKALQKYSPLAGLTGTTGVLTRLMEEVPEAALVMDENGGIVAANSAVEGLFGHDVATLPGQNLSLLMAEESRKSHDGYLSDLIDTGAPHTHHMPRTQRTRQLVTGLHRDGHNLRLEIDLHEAHNDDQRLFVSFLRKVT